MLDFYYRYPKVLSRLRDGALGADLDRIARYLHEHGYKPESVRLYIRRIAGFSAFVADKAEPAPIDQDLINRYIQAFGPSSRIAVQTAIWIARRILPERFSVPSPNPDPHEALLNAYLGHLRRIRGLEIKTCEEQILAASRMLKWHNRNFPNEPLAVLTGEHVLALAEYLLGLSVNARTRSGMMSYCRNFLRFLHWDRLISQDLARFVPRSPCYRLAHLPPHLAWDDVRRAIDAIDTSTPVGKRDRAITLLVATTGLRNKELRTLRLQDIRWRKSEVHVRWTKAKRDRVVPLLEEAGEALADYVLHARPNSDCERVFLVHSAPVRPIDSSSAMSRIVRSVLERGGLEVSRIAGAHLVRHSLATQLVRQRRPINEVADLLGHRSIDTTAIYVKVAVPQLADVALPFPGGAL